ncbi:MAG: bifunctional YncE family protein/alkaline phosphatase family protein [Acidobacteria bacterium]|nr:bifunctional YncE family protein/alkaline phosphatase family protein [Acidobacteriota bacterium]
MKPNYIRVFAALLANLAAAAFAQEVLPNTGQRISPLAPAGASFAALNPGLADNPKYVAGQAVTAVVSPDGRTLLVLTSGFNMLRSRSGAPIEEDSTQFIFIYDISNARPVQKQVIQLPNTYSGITFDPAGAYFYASGGVDDDVHAYALGENGRWTEEAGSPIPLGHNRVGIGISVKPEAAGIAVSSDGRKLVVANYYNDSISILRKDQSGWKLAAELDLRPGREDPGKAGVAGGEYPLWVAVKGTSIAYVSSVRDREIVVVDFAGDPRVVARIPVPGQPNRMVLNRNQSRLFVAEDNTDSVAVIDTGSLRLAANIPATAPAGLLPRSKSTLKGNDTNSVTLSPDEKFLYVTNGWMNDVAVIELGRSPAESRVVGLIPTGWYPNAISFSEDGKFAYVVNGKSPTGPNPGSCKGLTPEKRQKCRGTNEYNLQLIKAGLQSFPTPASDELARLTLEVARNNNFQAVEKSSDAAKVAFLRAHIKHVIYIVKENRTYDQVLGDLGAGNGDPDLAEFPETVTPNFHRLARAFSTLDNFYDTSEVSFDGWPWSTSARALDLVEKEAPVNYAGRGLSYDTEGTNRNINVGIKTLAGRRQANPATADDPDELPGAADVAAPDGPEGEPGAGYLWNAVLERGRSVRNYGFFIDLGRYHPPPEFRQYRIPALVDPASTRTQVAYPTSAALAPYTDIYFRGFDNVLPDYYRFKEWEREFDSKYAGGDLPDLSLVRFMHDHTGDFGEAILGVNTPELQVADNDYAVGLLVEKIARSRYRDDTLIFVIEDDSQDGGDHVDSHRSVAFVIGPYVKQKAVDSTPYTTLSMLRTMEEILGVPNLNLNDASANVMADVFDTSQKTWNYTAVPSAMLYNTQLPLPPRRSAKPIPQPVHDAAYWAAATRGMDFSVEDRVDPATFNQILWRGLMGGKPYPRTASGSGRGRHGEEPLKLDRPAQGAHE